MDKKTEALKLALEALEEINKLSIGENAICLPAEIDTAMDAIHEALAEAQQEPVIDKSAAIRIATALGWEPRREWVGLTKEERQHIWRNLENGGGPSEFADAIEAKLKEKNT